MLDIAAEFTTGLRPSMPNSLLRTETPPINETDEAAIACALRTLEAEAGGLAALSAAIAGTLGRAFSAAIAMITAARGRVIVSGMGKSGHIGNKIAATLSSTGTPASSAASACCRCSRGCWGSCCWWEAWR